MIKKSAIRLIGISTCLLCAMKMLVPCCLRRVGSRVGFIKILSSRSASKFHKRIVSHKMLSQCGNIYSPICPSRPFSGRFNKTSMLSTGKFILFA